MVEAFGKDKIELVEDTYMNMTEGLLPDRMYQLAENNLKEKLDISSCLRLRDHCKNDATISFSSKISEKDLEKMTKQLFEEEKYHHLRQFSDNYGELAKPIINKLIKSYIQEKEIDKSRRLGMYLPKAD